MVFGTKSSSKTKLFEQPLEKLFSPKTIEQYNDMIKAKEATLRSNNNNNHIGNNVNRTLSASSWARLSQENSATKRKRAAARLRRFTIQITKTTAETSTSTSSSPSSASSSSSPPMQSDPNAPVDASQEQLLAVLPEPIRSLLNELYQRGPSTVGIFRKSPNAKHCRELRQRLESDGQSSIEQFQVNVIASVFKEWLRSLPDCLLMSKLYPQWIDVAKLIEPLHLSQQVQQQQQQQRLSCSSSSSNDYDNNNPGQNSLSESLQDGQHPSLRPPDGDGRQTAQTTTSLMTDKGDQHRHHEDSKPLARARSCSLMTSNDDDDHHHHLNLSHNHRPLDAPSPIHRAQINQDDKRPAGDQDKLPATSTSAAGFEPPASQVTDTQTTDEKMQQMRKMSDFELRERHSECVRIVGQLLETLNEVNLILLRSIVCVLWHIANNCDLNKMSATNLGVCVGQSLLNDERRGHQAASSSSSQVFNTSGGHSSLAHRLSAASTFTKRHRRARSQCLLSSTLSLSNLATTPSPASGGQRTNSSSSNTNHSASYLSSNTAQETAKYVPILVAFMIDNARLLFGQSVISLFGPPKDSNNNKCDLQEPDTTTSGANNQTNCDTTPTPTPTTPTKEVACSPASTDSRPDQQGANSNSNNIDLNNRSQSIFRRQQNVVGRINLARQATGERFVKTHRRHLSTSVLVHVGDNNQQQQQPEVGQQQPPANETTSILIVNHTPRRRTPDSTTGSTSNRDDEEEDDDDGEEELRGHRQHQTTTGGQGSSSPTSCSSDSGVGCPSSQQDEKQQQQRPLSATESTSSSSSYRASSSTSGVHSSSPAFSSSEPTRSGQNSRAASNSTCSTGSLSSPAPSSSMASGCASPVDSVDVVDSTSRSPLDSAGHRPTVRNSQRRRLSEGGHLREAQPAKDVTSDNQQEAAARVGLMSASSRLLSAQRSLPVPTNNHQRPRSMVSLDEVAHLTRHHQQQQHHHHHQQHLYSTMGRQREPSSQFGRQTLDRLSCPSSASQQEQQGGFPVPNNRMPKIPFQYTTSCYGGEAVLYYPSQSHLQSHQQQQQQQQVRLFQRQPVVSSQNVECQRSQSLNNHGHHYDHQQPQRSHVMLLRDYYLSLQQNQSQKQQQQNSYRLSREAQQQQHHFLSQPQHQQQQQHHQNHLQRSTLADLYLQEAQVNQQLMQRGLATGEARLAAMQQHQPAAVAQQRAQPRLARIRPNQFNGLYVKRADSHQDKPTAPNAPAPTSFQGPLGVCPLGGCKKFAAGPSKVASEAAQSKTTSSMASSSSQQSSKVSSASSSSADELDESDCLSSEGWLEEEESTMV